MYPQNEAPNRSSLTGDIKIHTFSQGFSWWTRGWQLFKKNAIAWVFAYIAVFILSMLTGALPFGLGFIFSMMLMSGLYVIADRTQHGGKFRLGDIFTGFKQGSSSLLLTAMLCYVIFQALFSVMGAEVYVEAATKALTDLQHVIESKGSEEEQQAALNVFMLNQMALTQLSLLAMLPCLLFIFSFVIAILNARQLSPLSSIKLGLKGTLFNTIALFGLNVMITLFGFLAMFTFGIGLLVVAPVSICAFYVAYKDIFCQDQALIDADSGHNDDIMSA